MWSQLHHWLLWLFSPLFLLWCGSLLCVGAGDATPTLSLGLLCCGFLQLLVPSLPATHPSAGSPQLSFSLGIVL